LSEFFVFFRELRALPYDLVLDFQGLFKSSVLVGMSRCKRKVGFSPGREGSELFLTEKVSFGRKTRVHAIDRYLSLITSVGCSVRIPQFAIPIRQIHRERVWEFLEKERGLPGGPLVLLHPGTRWKSKLWEEEKWAALGDLLSSEHGADVVFTGSEGDSALISRISDRMKIPGINTAGKWGLKELAFLQMQADVVVVPDSGPMHLAAAVGTPVVALFGPTDPVLTGPYPSDRSGKNHTVITAAVDCGPCFKRTCSSGLCMTDITTEEVLKKTIAYLAISHSGALKAWSR
jgi:3-deoxy-D-manno-octulosonic-acid transferase/heptosyltransferase-1